MEKRKPRLGKFGIPRLHASFGFNTGLSTPSSDIIGLVLFLTCGTDIVMSSLSLILIMFAQKIK